MTIEQLAKTLAEYTLQWSVAVKAFRDMFEDTPENLELFRSTFWSNRK